MRDYGKVHTSFWSSSTISGMTDDGRILSLYLLTSPHTNIIGAFRLPDGYVCEDLKWTSQRVSKGFAELFAKGFANRCETTKFVWIVKHLEWNPPENPNQKKAAVKCVVAIPVECVWKPLFMRVCGPSLGMKEEAKTEPLDNPSATLPKPEAVTEAEKKPLSGEPDVAVNARQVLSYLNERAGKAFRPVPVTLDPIRVRLESGVTVEQCRQVIDAKVTEWGSDPAMEKYLRPATLFGATKFEQYLGAIGAKRGPQAVPKWTQLGYGSEAEMLAEQEAA